MFDRYFALLRDLELHLARYDDKRWPPLLSRWIHELTEAQNDTHSRIAHLQRTQHALSGMGSIADVVIAPEAGHQIADDENVIRAANHRLLQLVAELDHEISRLLKRLDADSNH